MIGHFKSVRGKLTIIHKLNESTDELLQDRALTHLFPSAAHVGTVILNQKHIDQQSKF